MAVIAHIILPNLSPAEYDKVRAESGWLETPPDGGYSHVAWWEGADNHNIDGWESEAACMTFAEQRLGPAMARVGVEIEPVITFHAAHEVYTPRQVTIV